MFEGYPNPPGSKDNRPVDGSPPQLVHGLGPFAEEVIVGV